MNRPGTEALVVVDVQCDFCAGGALAVPDGDKVVKPLNKMIEYAVKNGWEVFASRDWHPAKTKHFKTWPPHCIQGTLGAEFHPLLRLPTGYQNFSIISKGLGDADDYSAFDGGMQPKARRLFVGGLATDYCVLSTVKAARKRGYEVTLLFDACRAVRLKPDDEFNAIYRMLSLGVDIQTVNSVLREH